MKDLEIVLKSVGAELQLGYLIDKLIKEASDELKAKHHHKSARLVEAVRYLQHAKEIIEGRVTPEDLDETAEYMRKRVEKGK